MTIQDELRDIARMDALYEESARIILERAADVLDAFYYCQKCGGEGWVTFCCSPTRRGRCCGDPTTVPCSDCS